MGRRILVISCDFLPLWFGQGIHHYRVTKDPLPDDAKIIDARINHFDRRGLHLLLESAAWDGPAEGGLIPYVEPMLTNLDSPPVPQT